MAKNKKEITHLNYGELHMYYPIKFDTKLSFSKLCDALSKSNVSFNKEYQQKIMDSLGVSLANTVNDFHQNMPCTDMDDIALSFKVRDFETNKIYQPHPGYKPAYEINAETIRIELLSSDSSIYLNVVNTELEALQQRISCCVMPCFLRRYARLSAYTGIGGLISVRTKSSSDTL